MTDKLDLLPICPLCGCRAKPDEDACCLSCGSTLMCALPPELSALEEEVESLLSALEEEVESLRGVAAAAKSAVDLIMPAKDAAATIAGLGKIASELRAAREANYTEGLERLAACVHQAYLDTCVKLGWAVKPSNAVPYEQLSEVAKELDRASVRAVLKGVGK